MDQVATWREDIGLLLSLIAGRGESGVRIRQDVLKLWHLVDTRLWICWQALESKLTADR